MSQQKVYAFGGLWDKKYETILKTEILIFQSSANFDEKSLFVKITHHLDQEIRKKLVRGMFGNENKPFSYSEEECGSNDVSLQVVEFRIFTIAIEALTPLFRTSHIKLYKNIARSRLFCRIAKRSIPHSIVVHDLIPIEIEILFLKLTIALNLNFNAT